MKSILKVKAAHNQTAMKMKSCIFKSLFFSLVTSLCILAQVNFCFAQSAGILAQAVTQFFDNNGNPLSLGKVYTYVAGTSTPKTTWMDPLEANPNTNPINLDIAGRATIYGQGTYTETVFDNKNNQIWTGLTQPIGVTVNQTLIGDGQPVGATFPWSGFIAPAQYAFAYGQTVSRTTYAALLSAITISANANCTSSSNIISGIADTTQIPVGAPVEFSCVSSATVVSKTSSTVTLSTPALSTITTTAVFFPWGNGDGSTTFNIPDLRGVALAGRPNMGGVDNGKLSSTYYGVNPDAAGAFGGSQSYALVQGNMPVTGPAFTGTLQTVSIAGGTPAGQVSYWNNTQAAATAGTGAANAAGFTTYVPTVTITPTGTIAGGSDTPLSRIQPTVTINYIIKITPDTNASTTNGVASLGGMTGNITCGTNIICSGNNISSSFVGIGGSGTLNYLPVWSNSTNIINSGVYLLPQGTSFYASPTGSDTGNTCNNSGSPCTLYGACAMRTSVATYLQSLNGSVTIQLADGTYSAVSGGALCSIFGDTGGSGTILTSLNGNCTNLTNVVLAVPANDVGVETKDLGLVAVNCIKFTGGNGSIGIQNAGQGAVVDYDKVTWGTWGTAGIHISISDGGYVNLGADGETITGNFTSSFHIITSGNANYFAGGQTNIPNAVSWSGGSWISSGNASGTLINLTNWSTTGAGVGGSTGAQATFQGPGYLSTAASAKCTTVLPGSGGCTFLNGFQDNAGEISPVPANTFSTLNANAGMYAYITDGKASNCGDSACTTWGTTVTGGTGALKLFVWNNGTNWTLIGK